MEPDLVSTSPAHRTGVLVMAYGTPASPEDVPGYYTHIRRGRPPTDEQLADLTRRYDAIGGVSPLRERTLAQMDAIGSALERDRPGAFTLALGHKHAAPFIEDGIAELHSRGVDTVVGLVLAPHYSAASVGQYHDRASEAAGSHGTRYVRIDDWSDQEPLITFMAQSLRAKLEDLPTRTRVVFTAHSLPERSLVDDPYADRLLASARVTAAKAGLAGGSDWDIGWQSAGRTADEWRGPDILTIIEDLASTREAQGVLVVPQGFTSDHLEVLYDLDIEAAAIARSAGLAFARTEVVNADPAVMAGLDRLVCGVAQR